jgi:hypothetical protein
MVVVGGHSRNVGKTSVVVGLIAALPEMRWTAVKITQHGHGICTVNGQPCDCACDERGQSMVEERDRSGGSDTSRFLVAGAEHSLWVRTEQGKLGEVIPGLQRRLQSAGSVIIESNSVLEFLKPTLYLAVLDAAVPDFKDSARRFLPQADAVILQGAPAPAAWSEWAHRQLTGKPVFRIQPPPYLTSAIAEFVRERISPAAGGKI